MPSLGSLLFSGSAIAAGTGTQLLGTQPAGANNVGVPNVGIDPTRVTAMMVQLNVTTVGTSVDVYLQHSIDGTNWDDFAHLAQATGVGISYVQWYRDINLLGAAASHVRSDAALAAATVLNGVNGDNWRIKYVVVGTPATFTVTARQIRAK
jgi:hypothetical protein